MKFYCRMDAAGSLQECFSQCIDCQSKATPGPWATSNDGVPEAFRPQVTVYAEADGERVATVFREEANARLIAAAPDLLAALDACVYFIENVTDEDPARSDRFFATRELWRAAYEKVQP